MVALCSMIPNSWREKNMYYDDRIKIMTSVYNIVIIIIPC